MFLHASDDTFTIYHPIEPLITVTRVDIDLSDVEGDTINRQKMDLLVKDWCLRNKYVTMNKDTAIFTPSKNVTHLPTRLCDLNFRSLVYEENYIGLVRALKDTPISLDNNRIVELYSRIVADVDTGYLTRYITRLYRSFETVIAHDAELPWIYIHKEIPYLWVVYLIHVAINDAQMAPAV